MLWRHIVYMPTTKIRTVIIVNALVSVARIDRLNMERSIPSVRMTHPVFCQQNNENSDKLTTDGAKEEHPFRGSDDDVNDNCPIYNVISKFQERFVRFG